MQRFNFSLKIVLRLKVFFRRIHLYLGMAAGLIITITCASGAVLVYEKELMQLFHHDRYFTQNSGSRLPIDAVLKAVTLSDTSFKANAVKVYTDVKRNVEISVSKSEQSKNTEAAKQQQKATNSRLTVFVDPYTAEIREVYNHKESFFYWVMDLHRWMLSGDIGKTVVGISTILFLFILITGIVLWWPKNKAILKQRLKIKTKAGFKRWNHDFHIVFGFYSAIFLFVLAFTGLAWSFEWFNKGIYTITGSSMERAKPPANATLNDSIHIPVQTALFLVQEKVPNAPYYNISLPKEKKEAFAVTILPINAAHESASDTYFVDAKEGKIIGEHLFKDRNIGQKIRATFKPIHVASIYGQTSKTIGFIVCLLGTFFPISGIILWFNRTRKKKTVSK